MFTLNRQRRGYIEDARKGKAAGIKPGKETDSLSGSEDSLRAGGGGRGIGPGDKSDALSGREDSYRSGVGGGRGITPGDGADTFAGNEDEFSGNMDHHAAAAHHQKLADYHRSKASDGTGAFSQDAGDGGPAVAGKTGYGDSRLTSSKTGGAAHAAHGSSGANPSSDPSLDDSFDNESLEDETPAEEAQETPEVEALETLREKAPNKRTPGEDNDAEMLSVADEERLEGDDKNAGNAPEKGGSLRNSKGASRNPISRFNQMRKGK